METMTKEELKELGLSDEQADKVLKGYDGYVPKERFNSVNEAKKKAEQEVADRDKQIEELKKAGNVDELKQKIDELQKQNKEASEKYAADLKNLKLDAAIKAALSNAQDVDIVAGLIDKNKLILGDDDKVTGLAEQVSQLQKDKAFLFKTTQQYNPANGNPPTENPFAKEHWNLTEQGKLFKENPEQARALAKAAGITI